MRKYTYIEVKEGFEEEGYTLKSLHYENATKKLDVICPKGHEIQMTWVAFNVSKTRCPVCMANHVGRQNAIDKEIANDRLLKKFHGEVTLVGEYVNNKTKTTFYHKTCDRTFHASYKHVLQGHFNCCGGIRIGKKLRKSHDQYCREVFDMYGDEFTILGKYETDNSKLLIRHNACGKEYHRLAGSLLQGHVCKFCRQSKGEAIISNFLDRKSVLYEREYRDARCVRKHKLPFDFAIFDKCNNIKALVEYDGELHYKQGGWSDSIIKYNSIKESEKLKTKFCLDYRIPLIRINYLEFDNIEQILEKELKQLNIC